MCTHSLRKLGCYILCFFFICLLFMPSLVFLSIASMRHYVPCLHDSLKKGSYFFIIPFTILMNSMRFYMTSVLTTNPFSGKSNIYISFNISNKLQRNRRKLGKKHNSGMKCLLYFGKHNKRKLRKRHRNE